MQPSRATAASMRTSGLRRCLRARRVMGGASLFLKKLVTVYVGGGGLISVIDLLAIDDRRVVASEDHHAQLVADRTGLSVRRSCTTHANSASGILGAGAGLVGG